MKFRNAEKTQSKAARQVFFDGMLEDSALNRIFIIIRMQFLVFLKLEIRYIINLRRYALKSLFRLKVNVRSNIAQAVQFLDFNHSVLGLLRILEKLWTKLHQLQFLVTEIDDVFLGFMKFI